MKKIIDSSNHSPLMMEKLNKYRDDDSKKALNLVNFIDIRWNSLFLAIERFIELLPQIQKTIIDENSRRQQVLL